MKKRLILFIPVVILMGMLALAVVIPTPPIHAQDDPPENINDALYALNRKLGRTSQLIGLEDLARWNWTFETYPTTGWECPQAFTEIRQEPSRAYKFTFVYDGVTYEFWQSQDQTILFLCTPTGREDYSPPPPPVIPTRTPGPYDACVILPRLIVGNEGQVLNRVVNGEDDPNNVRSAPDANSDKIGEIPSDGRFKVLEGPICGAEYNYWRVDYNGLIGWTAEGRRNEYFVQPIAPPDYSRCGVQPRLIEGQGGRVIDTGNALKIREMADVSSTELGRIPSGETFLIVEGPTCSGEFVWWSIQYGTLTGFVAEGSRSGGYLVEPAEAPISPAVTPEVAGTPTAATLPPYPNCPIYPRLQVGDVAVVIVTPGDDLNLRAEPNTSAQILTVILPDQQVTVLEGPTCTDQFVYWKVDFGGLGGWAAEGNAAEYWLRMTSRAVSVSGVTFQLDGRLASGVTSQIVPSGEAAANLPEHVWITLYNGDTAVGTMRVFLAQNYAELNAGSISSLQDAVVQQKISAEGLPSRLQNNALPLQGNHPIVAQGQYLIGANGQGWRQISAEGEPRSLIYNPVVYESVVLTADGNYLIHLTLNTVYPPLPADEAEALAETGLPADQNDAAWQNFDFAGYLAGVNQTLRLADPLNFNPPLAVVDTLMGSLSFSQLALTPQCGEFVSRLRIGMTAGRVTANGSANTIRALPSTTTDRVGSIPAGESFEIIGGMRCAEGYMWWPVRYQGVEGWTVEGDTNGYWVEPIP